MTGTLSVIANEQRLRELITAAIPDHMARLTVLLAAIDYGLACEKAGIATMQEMALPIVRRGSVIDG